MSNYCTCKCCSRRTEAHLCVTCSICKNPFNHSCVGLTASETRSINSKRSVNWTCGDCENIATDIKSISSALVALRKEIEELKSSKSYTGVPDLSPQHFEEILQELNERNSRKNNFLAFNIPEQSSSLSKSDRLTAEMRDVSELITSASSDIPLDNIRVLRLGKFIPTSSRPRPLKITLSDAKYVHEIVKNSKRLRSIDKFKNVTVSFDRTSRQINLYNDLKREMAERVQNGETNLKIKYINGVPKIVDLN